MQFALLISVIIGVLLSSFLLLTHVQSFFRIKSNELINASDLVNQQLFKSLENPVITTDTISHTIDNKSIKLISNYHGVWTKIMTTVEIENRNVAKKNALVGSSQNLQTPNLYLANKNTPLVVVGDTRLEGNSYLPDQGIKAGNISGEYFQGSRLYYGTIRKGKEDLPELDPAWVSYIERLSKGLDIDQEDIIPLQNEIENSFYKPAKVVYSDAPISLTNQKISGNIIIQSTSTITINAATQLTDVILIAPTIRVHNNVKSRFQILATKKIEIGKNCHLSYPSSVTFFDIGSATSTQEKNSSQRVPEIVIDEGTKIDGAMVFIKKNEKKINYARTNIKTHNNTQFIGEIYCQGNIDFQGTVKGSLYTNQFVANQKGSIYLNHIYNGKVLNNPIPNHAGIPFKNSKKSVVKWLY